MRGLCAPAPVSARNQCERGLTRVYLLKSSCQCHFFDVKVGLVHTGRTTRRCSLQFKCCDDVAQGWKWRGAALFQSPVHLRSVRCVQFGASGCCARGASRAVSLQLSGRCVTRLWHRDAGVRNACLKIATTCGGFTCRGLTLKAPCVMRRKGRTARRIHCEPGAGCRRREQVVRIHQGFCSGTRFTFHEIIQTGAKGFRCRKVKDESR